ncbi:MAG: 3'-5' exonuclease, partial [Nitrososphaerota archaeon]
MKITGEFLLLDVAVEVENGKPSIWLWCKDRNGETYVVKQAYSPSFYIVSDKTGEVLETLRSQQLRVEEVDRKIRGRNVKAVRVFVDVEDVESAARKITRNLRNVEVFEEDIRTSVKYLIERGLKPSGGIRVEGKLTEDKEFKVIEAEKVEYVPDIIPSPLRVLSFNAVYYSKSGSPRPERDPIILISIATSKGSRVQLTGDERKIIQEFLKIIEKEDPDVIVGFSSNRIHWNYLMERARIHGLKLTVGRLSSEPHTSIHGHVSIRGRLNIDFEDMARDIPELTVETLEEFVNYLGLQYTFDVV